MTHTHIQELRVWISGYFFLHGTSLSVRFSSCHVQVWKRPPLPPWMCLIMISILLSAYPARVYSKCRRYQNVKQNGLPAWKLDRISSIPLWSIELPDRGIGYFCRAFSAVPTGMDGSRGEHLWSTPKPPPPPDRNLKSNESDSIEDK